VCATLRPATLRSRLGLGYDRTTPQQQNGGCQGGDEARCS
jgi:hypothetical protein